MLGWLVNNAIRPGRLQDCPRLVPVVMVSPPSMPGCSVPIALNATRQIIGMLPIAALIQPLPMKEEAASTTVAPPAENVIPDPFAPQPVPPATIATTRMGTGEVAAMIDPPFELTIGLPKLGELDILPPIMSILFARRHHHHQIQTPHGREVSVRVPAVR